MSLHFSTTATPFFMCVKCCETFILLLLFGLGVGVFEDGHQVYTGNNNNNEIALTQPIDWTQLLSGFVSYRRLN